MRVLSSCTVKPREGEGLASHCTLGVGGPARFFVDAPDEATAIEAVQWARARGVALFVLGGGSNLVVADDGVDGLVLRMSLRGLSERTNGGAVELTAAAGEPWDGLVAHAVARGWAGLECLSGIPGLVGATPIQNVGAYGQEVSDTITAVRAHDRRLGRTVTLAAADCSFGYRDSLLKSAARDRYVVLAVTYRLAPGGRPAVRYADVERRLADSGLDRPTLAQVRDSVIAIRREKSMVLDPRDPNHRSCGSFFLNPVVSAADAARVEAAAGVAVPRWPQPGGRLKLSAAWLIERAGFARGMKDGAVGLSTRHALAIVCHDGARASDVIALAGKIRAAVQDRFGVGLTPEPAFWPPVAPGSGSA